jgi:nitrogen regulatory protein PII
MNGSDMMEIVKACVIVNLGVGSKVLHKAMDYGIRGGTVLLGTGTMCNRLLECLGLSDSRKEIVYMVAQRKTAHEALSKLNQDFEFEKPNHGIAFTTAVATVVGTHGKASSEPNDERGANKIMYNAITTIVDRGRAEDVIDAAAKAGSKGGTIIKARGSGVHETSKLFAMDIEPEKEVVLILAESDKTNAIVESIRKALKLDDPGQGILFVQEVLKTYGIFK